jgi:hypothetical protein
MIVVSTSSEAKLVGEIGANNFAEVDKSFEEERRKKLPQTAANCYCPIVVGVMFVALLVERGGYRTVPWVGPLF